MTDLLLQISGPVFLLLYLAAVITGLVIYHKLSRKIDFTYTEELSDHRPLTSAEVAVVKYKNVQPLIKTILVGLFENKYIQFLPDGKVEISKGNRPEKISVTDKIVYDYFKTPQNPRSVLRDSTVRYQMKHQVDEIKNVLIGKGIYRNAELKRKLFLLNMGILSVILIFAFTKISLASQYHHPVGYLTFLIILTLISFIAKMPGNLSFFGKKEIEKLEDKFKWVKDVHQPVEAPDNFDPMMTTALFGMGTLLLFSDYSVLGNDFPETKEMDNYSASGCSSCGSSSSGSDGGSSNGGSSCSSCSSGCGGCGGGD
jgi:uncharacterized protein (TIGR04222 family)